MLPAAAIEKPVRRNFDMKKQAFNPYLPSWEYIPDGEPHVFEDRVYVYGSHDRFNGHAYCLNDYVCWSAPTDDLSDWRYEGVIYKKTDDPFNEDGSMCLYAPDVTKGPDGRYYLYYVLDKKSCVSVAVCDSPAGKYEFYGYVQYEDGSRLGEREGDEPQFDPAVITEGDCTYLYTGFCPVGDTGRSGPMATVLGPDMVTIQKAPAFIAPSEPYSAGSGFEGHEFFEAPSIRKVGQLYYFVYSSVVFHELCYAVSEYPDQGFRFGGVIVSNNDLHIDTYKPAEKPMYYGGNNHGGMVQVQGKWYIFYHRQTNGTSFSRQTMAEEIEILPDGSIPQVEMTSCGLNGGPLVGRGEYPAYIACNLFCDVESSYTGGIAGNGFYVDSRCPRITQDGRDGDEEQEYIMNMTDSATCGFKYFDCQNVRRIGIRVRGYCKGAFQVKTSWDGEVLGEIPVDFTNVWKEYSADITIPDGLQSLYFTYRGSGSAALSSFYLD
jgi:arabinoxylan arabinofuranohydrolase